MKRISPKIPAILAMLTSIVSFSLVIAAFSTAANEPPVTEGVSCSFGLWVYSVICAGFSLLLYAMDALDCFTRAINKIHTRFHTLLAVIIFGSIPMFFFVGTGLGICILVWNVYYLVLFILEAISLFIYLKNY